MPRIPLVMLLTAVPTLLVGSLLWNAALADTKRQTSSPPQTPPGLLNGYRQWRRVNPTPHRVVSRLALLCRSLTPAETATLAADPHKDKWVTVYVNPPGAQVMMRALSPRFPQGTIIVKEKKAGPTDKTPELLTVMRKREPGYDPAHGDWQYLVLNGTATQIQAEGHLQNCQSCHAQWQKTDYVSREYLPASAVAALR